MLDRWIPYAIQNVIESCKCVTGCIGNEKHPAGIEGKKWIGRGKKCVGLSHLRGFQLLHQISLIRLAFFRLKWNYLPFQREQNPIYGMWWQPFHVITSGFCVNGVNIEEKKHQRKTHCRKIIFFLFRFLHSFVLFNIHQKTWPVVHNLHIIKFDLVFLFGCCSIFLNV